MRVRLFYAIDFSVLFAVSPIAWNINICGNGPWIVLMECALFVHFVL